MGLQMFLSGGLISCQSDHTHNILICNSYNTDLYLSWSMEIWTRLRVRSNVNSAFLDISSFSFDKQVFLRAQLKRMLFRRHKLRNLVAYRYLPDSIEHELPSKISVVRKASQIIFNLIKILPALVRCKSIDSLLEMNQISNVALRSAHSTLSGKLGTVEYNPRKHIFVLISYFFSFQLIEFLFTHLAQQNKYCQVVVGNGRLLNSAAALSGLGNQVSKLIVERGAKPGMLDTYKVSAHSMSERRSHLDSLWESVDDNLAKSIAIEYLETRRVRDPISGVNWTSQQRSGELPFIEEGKKVCVFYTTTELEFAVFYDTSKPDEFRTQSEALLALVEALDPSEWIIYVRRHPYSKKVKCDPEGVNWKKFSEIPNVRFIQPQSSVDSYALGARADLVAHYNSSIGPELIFLETCPVITLGDNPWESLNSKYLLRTKEKLEQFLAQDLPIRPKADSFKWAYYSAVFGEPFKFVEWRNFRASVNGKHILSRDTRRRRGSN